MITASVRDEHVAPFHSLRSKLQSALPSSTGEVRTKVCQERLETSSFTPPLPSTVVG